MHKHDVKCCVRAVIQNGTLLLSMSYFLIHFFIYLFYVAALNTPIAGLAYGLITSVQNFGLALFPIIVASIFNYSKSRYIPNCEYFFIFISSVAFFIGIYLNYLDRKNGSVLNSPSTPTMLIRESMLHSPSKSELYADIENDGRNFDTEEYLITDRKAFRDAAI